MKLLPSTKSSSVTEERIMNKFKLPKILNVPPTSNITANEMASRIIAIKTTINYLRNLGNEQSLETLMQMSCLHLADMELKHILSHVKFSIVDLSDALETANNETT